MQAQLDTSWFFMFSTKILWLKEVIKHFNNIFYCLIQKNLGFRGLSLSSLWISKLCIEINQLVPFLETIMFYNNLTCRPIINIPLREIEYF